MKKTTDHIGDAVEQFVFLPVTDSMGSAWPADLKEMIKRGMTARELDNLAAAPVTTITSTAQGAADAVTGPASVVAQRAVDDFPPLTVMEAIAGITALIVVTVAVGYGIYRLTKWALPSENGVVSAASSPETAVAPSFDTQAVVQLGSPHELPLPILERTEWVDFALQVLATMLY